MPTIGLRKLVLLLCFEPVYAMEAVARVAEAVPAVLFALELTQVVRKCQHDQDAAPAAPALAALTAPAAPAGGGVGVLSDGSSLPQPSTGIMHGVALRTDGRPCEAGCTLKVTHKDCRCLLFGRRQRAPSAKAAPPPAAPAPKPAPKRRNRARTSDAASAPSAQSPAKHARPNPDSQAPETALPISEALSQGSAFFGAPIGNEVDEGPNDASVTWQLVQLVEVDQPSTAPAAPSVAKLDGSTSTNLPPPTAEEALAQAEAEGLTLLRSESSNTGYMHVTFKGSRKSRPYQARVKRDCQHLSLGNFATAEEAALCYARTPEAQAAVAALALADMTAEEALQQAVVEGLTLLRSEFNRTGYTGVSCEAANKSKSKPYQAKVKRDCQHLSLGYFATAEERGSKFVHLGYFATAEEAALCYARASAAQTAAPQPPATSSRKRKVRSEEQPPDMPADLVVILEGRFVDTTFEYYGL